MNETMLLLVILLWFFAAGFSKVVAGIRWPRLRFPRLRFPSFGRGDRELTPEQEYKAAVKRVKRAPLDEDERHAALAEAKQIMLQKLRDSMN